VPLISPVFLPFRGGPLTLVFVGLGLERGGMSIRGLEEVKKADAVYAELYTSVIPGLSVEELERLTGKKVKVVDRKTVEEDPKEILEAARRGRVAFLVPGDPMTATTHVDLRLRAHRAGIQTEIVHAGSILSAVVGMSGLQSYKFGPTATVPFPDNPSSRPYDVLAENKIRGLHTLLLLDLRAEEGRAMTATEAMQIMLALEEKHRRGVFTLRTPVIVIARAGGKDQLVRGGRVADLIRLNFGGPPHCMVVPGRLHFIEAEALKVFAEMPEDAVDELGG
jgi:diphthine synthase